MLFKFRTTPVDHCIDGNARCVGANNYPFFPHFFHTLKQLLLDGKIFDNHLHHPIDFLYSFQIILDIARGYK